MKLLSSFKGEPEGDVDLALRGGRVYISPIVVSELFSAKLSKSQRVALEDFLRELPLVDVSLEHWIRVGELRSILASKGLAVSTPDAHIAQCCLDLDCLLVI